MGNQGWTNGGGGGEQVSSTARTSGRGSTTEPAFPGSKVAAHGGDNDPLGSVGDLFEVPGNLSES